jgi:phenylacetate-CoA ligase
LNLRTTIIWTLDKLKGSSIQQALQYTKSILEARDRAWVEDENNKNLSKLLNHTVDTTSFYRGKIFNSLDDFPVVNKNLIRDDFEAFFSEKFNKSDCKIVSTSGSTGSPFSVYQNKTKVNKIKADNLYFSSIANYDIGRRLVFIRIWPQVFGLASKTNFVLKNIMPWNILNLSNKAIAELINKLNKQKESLSFLGYPSAFEKICKYVDTLDENPIQFKSKSIITISETLNPYTKLATKKYFGITPLSRYSNNESGIMAQQMNSEDVKFRINESSYVIEILDLNKDEKLPYGESGRIVITDLYNFAIPLIRYDTGDIGILELDIDGRPFLTEILGRRVDQLYDTKGNIISSHLSLRLMDYGEFKQFQLVQKSKKEYHINLNTDQKVNEDKLISDYIEHFGKDAIIKINYVNEIPLLASGKRREVVNEYYN